MTKIKMSVSGLVIFTSIVFLLNFLLIFLFIVYFYLDKGNVVSILFAEKIIILDIAIICAIGKTNDWPIFKYLNHFKAENPKTQIIQKKKKNKIRKNFFKNQE